jgi:hypothetical protein
VESYRVQLASCSLSSVWLMGLRSYSSIRRFDSRPSSTSVKRCMPFSNSWIEAISMAFRRGKMKGSSLDSPCMYSVPMGRDSRLSFSLFGLMVSWMYSRMLVAIGSLGLPFGFPLCPFLNGIDADCLLNNSNNGFGYICNRKTLFSYLYVGTEKYAY